MAKLAVIISNYKKRSQAVFQDACLELSSKVVTRTPVHLGSLRASWHPNIGEPVAKNVDININDDSPMPDRNKISSVIARLDIGDKFSLGNGQPYARPIEYEGHSPQAPEGMLRRSVEEWPDIVKRAINGNK